MINKIHFLRYKRRAQQVQLVRFLRPHYEEAGAARPLLAFCVQRCPTLQREVQRCPTRSLFPPTQQPFACPPPHTSKDPGQSCNYVIWREKSKYLGKYTLQFGQIQFLIWTNILGNLNIYFHRPLQILVSAVTMPSASNLYKVKMTNISGPEI